jgi:hypothetical protein
MSEDGSDSNISSSAVLVGPREETRAGLENFPNRG